LHHEKSSKYVPCQRNAAQQEWRRQTSAKHSLQ
jgi:hypothetical protein